MGCSKVRYTCLLENERDMKQDSCFKNIWKINICNVGTLTVETLQVVLENRTYSLTASLYLRLGSRWRTPWELQHREREAQENSLLIQLDPGVLLTDLPAGNHMSRPHLFNIYFLLMCSWFMGFPGGSEVWSLVRSLGQEDLLQKAMATHPSILAWRIPWTEEPCGLESMGSQRVRHNWATHAHRVDLQCCVSFRSTANCTHTDLVIFILTSNGKIWMDFLASSASPDLSTHQAWFPGTLVNVWKICELHSAWVFPQFHVCSPCVCSTMQFSLPRGCNLPSTQALSLFSKDLK